MFDILMRTGKSLLVGIRQSIQFKNPQDLKYFNKLLWHTIIILSASIFGGYISVIIIAGLGFPNIFQIKIPLFAGSQNLSNLFWISIWNLLISGLSLVLLVLNPVSLDGKLEDSTPGDTENNKALKEEVKLKRSIRRKQWGLVILSFSGIGSIYVIVNFTGGFFWSPFTGYYSLIVTTLSLCLSIWSSRDNLTGKILWAIFVTLALLVVVFISVSFDPIPLVTKHKIDNYNNLLQSKKQINTLLDIGCNTDRVNSKMILEDDTIILTGILSETKEDNLISDINALKMNIPKETSLKNDIISAVRSVGMQSRLIDENENSYRTIFMIIIAISTILSIFLTIPTYINRGEWKDKRQDALQFHGESRQK